MRLPYVSNPPEFESPADQAVLHRVQERRGERGLLKLDLALLHSPPVADGWNSFIGAIRQRTSLPTSVRELAICRVAVLNKAWYEWKSHSPILRDAGDLNEEAIQEILNSPPTGRDAGASSSSTSKLPEKYRIVMAFTDASTVDVAVPDAVFEKLKAHFTDREIVEITATVAAYNCVSRFLVALDIGEQNGQPKPDS
ncbi:4-carboxymuconolactone decarboxylase-like protein [Phyllosticta citribraziliensis]